MKQISDFEKLDPEAVTSWTTGRRYLFRIGILLALGSFFSYFGLTLSLPDSAGYTWVQEVLAVVGTCLVLFGWWRLPARLTLRIGAVMAVAATGLLLGYIHLYTSRLPSTEGVIEVGRQAPSFILPGPDGNAVALESFLGKPLVLVFYRGYW